MKRTIQVAGLLLVALSVARSAPKNEPGFPRAGSGNQKGRGVPKLANPGTAVQQLMRMAPEQRERALEKLPPQQQAQIRQRLQQFDNLPKPEQERRLQLGETFAKLPPDKQDLVLRQIRAVNQLADDRRQMVRVAFQRLRRLPDAERQARLANPQFRSRFSPAELQMLADLSENLPLPPIQ